MGIQRVLMIAGSVVVATALALIVSPATAQDAPDVIEVPLADTYASANAGDTVEMGSASVDASLVGRSCDVVASIVNGGSVHPGNKLVVTSGDSTVEIAGIEDSADATVTNGGSLTLADSISVSVVLGDDGKTSIASTMKVTCEAPKAEPADPVPAEPTYTG